jgi:hypothetical protein
MIADRSIVRGDLLPPTEEIALEEQERAVVVTATTLRPRHR